NSGEKPYACSHALCGRKFARISDLRSHERIHSADSKPFECKHCGKRFTRRHDLKKHVVNIHQQIPSSMAIAKKTKARSNSNETDASSVSSHVKGTTSGGRTHWRRMGPAAGPAEAETEVQAFPRKKRQRVAAAAELTPPLMKALPTSADSLYSDGLACSSQQQVQVEVQRQMQQQMQQLQLQMQQQQQQQQQQHRHHHHQHGPQQDRAPERSGRAGSSTPMPLAVTVPLPSSSLLPPPSGSVQGKPGAQPPRRIHHKRVRCDAHKHCEPPAAAAERRHFPGGKSVARGLGRPSDGDLIKQLGDKDRQEMARKERLGHVKSHVHGAACGHVAVLHEDHVDFIVGSGQLECYEGKEKTREGWVSSTTEGSGSADTDCGCDDSSSKSNKADVVGKSGGKPATRDDLVHWDGLRPEQPRENCQGDAHGPQCGHDVIHHDGHLDYVVNGRLLHPVQEDRLAVAGGGTEDGEDGAGTMLFEDHGSIRSLDDDFVTFWSSLDVLSETADEAVISWCDMCCSDGGSP
ncbi:unnamed protein product, partial [Hapterophycus canaliculatus]